MRFLAFFLGIFLALGSLVTSCTPEDKPAPSPKNIPLAKVLILCEGNFLWENAQLDVWLPDSQMLISNAYEKQNNKPLGDILQSGLYSNGRLWLSVNNSGKILELDPKTLIETQKNITPNFPRYLSYLPSINSLFATDLKKNQVRELDATNLSTKHTYSVLPQKTGEFSGWTEHILVWNEKIVAANLDGNLLIIDPISKNQNLLKIDSGASYLSIDRYNQLWVACISGKESSLIQIKQDLDTTPIVISGTVESSFPFSAPSIDLVCNGNYIQTLYGGGSVNDISELIIFLNSEPNISYLGTYSDAGDGGVLLEIPTNLVNQFCSSGTLTFEVFSD
jgi:hypothetical protein